MPTTSSHCGSSRPVALCWTCTRNVRFWYTTVGLAPAVLGPATASCDGESASAMGESTELLVDVPVSSELESSDDPNDSWAAEANEEAQTSLARLLQDVADETGDSWRTTVARAAVGEACGARVKPGQPSAA